MRLVRVTNGESSSRGNLSSPKASNFQAYIINSCVANFRKEEITANHSSEEVYTQSLVQDQDADRERLYSACSDFNNNNEPALCRSMWLGPPSLQPTPTGTSSMARDRETYGTDILHRICEGLNLNFSTPGFALTQ